jgi:hypothetical protein
MCIELYSTDYDDTRSAARVQHSTVFPKTARAAYLTAQHTTHDSQLRLLTHPLDCSTVGVHAEHPTNVPSYEKV